MDIAQILNLVCLAGIVIIPYMAVMAGFAIVGTAMKQDSARRIWKAQARGAFADLETPKNKSRFWLLGGIALLGVLGFACSIAILVLQIVTKFSTYYWVTIVFALLLGSIGAVAGLLMNREVNRRL